MQIKATYNRGRLEFSVPLKLVRDEFPGDSRHNAQGRTGCKRARGQGIIFRSPVGEARKMKSLVFDVNVILDLWL